MSHSALKFTKMNGLGNDFVVFKGPLSLSPQQISSICHRKTGIGADGLLVISHNGNNVVMEYWNNDGSIAEMCGNGLRCATRFAIEQKMVTEKDFSIQTGAGLLKVKWDGENHDKIEIQVGKAIISDQKLTYSDQLFHLVNVGNPHAVTFVEDIKNAPVETLGPEVENHSYFPNRTNVEFVHIIDKKHIKIRIWERGVGETLACGTGMIAVAALTNHLKLTTFPLSVDVPGGSATIWRDNEGYMRMKAPALVDFEGDATQWLSKNP